ncbi:MAG: prefoldin subunit [Candidatus Aenigmarchaeota archaeon]|nr:prefoldin subunit [Candidatus Aenigmarchaeota archaeon]
MSDETKQMILEFQAYQQQLQSVAMQRESMKLQDLEIDKAVEELEKSGQKTAFKITGSVMVSKPVEDIVTDLKETKEAISIRMRSYEKTEAKITERLKEIQEKLKEEMK